MNLRRSLKEAYTQGPDYNREDVLVWGRDCNWGWVAGLISEDEDYHGLDWMTEKPKK